MVPRTLTDVADAVYSHPEYAAPVFALLAAYFLYGILGKRLLGYDDDFWEKLRAYLIPKLSTFTMAAGAGYVYTDALDSEFAGKVQMSEEQFEKKLQEAGYLRQPIASLHRRESGTVEDGSWSKTYGPLYFGEAIAAWFTKGKLRVPYLAEYTRRFLSALNTVFALKQRHAFYYVKTGEKGHTWIGVYGHNEFNPINPLTALRHYNAKQFEPAPEDIRQDLKRVGVTFAETGE